jgi:hypothetical protein
MNIKPYNLHDGKKGAALAIRVKARGKKNVISGILSDGTVKIELTAPPVEGKANEALLKFLASKLEVSINRLEIVAGDHGKEKLVTILDMDPATLNRKMLEITRG